MTEEAGSKSAGGEQRLLVEYTYADHSRVDAMDVEDPEWEKAADSLVDELCGTFDVRREVESVLSEAGLGLPAPRVGGDHERSLRLCYLVPHETAPDLVKLLEAKFSGRPNLSFSLADGFEESKFSVSRVEAAVFGTCPECDEDGLPTTADICGDCVVEAGLAECSYGEGCPVPGRGWLDGDEVACSKCGTRFLVRCDEGRATFRELEKED